MRNLIKTIATSTALLLPSGALAGTVSALLFESGSDLIMEYSGSIDTNGFNLVNSGTGVTGLDLGPTNGLYLSLLGDFSVFGVSVTGPSYGPGGQISRDNQPSSGDTFGFFVNESEIVTPLDYVSGDPIEGTSTVESATLEDLGATPGTYIYETVVNGMATNTITLTVVGTAPIPLPAAGWMLLAGVGGLYAFRRHRKDRNTRARERYQGR